MAVVIVVIVAAAVVVVVVVVVLVKEMCMFANASCNNKLSSLYQQQSLVKRHDPLNGGAKLVLPDLIRGMKTLFFLRAYFSVRQFICLLVCLSICLSGCLSFYTSPAQTSSIELTLLINCVQLCSGRWFVYRAKISLKESA